MEIWDLIDENRNKIGKTHVRGEKIPKGLYHLGADLWIVNSKREILIQKRSLEKESNPGVWAMTSGSALTGETSREAIKRETFEELGIEVKENNLKLVNSVKSEDCFIDIYILEEDISIDDIKIQKEEVSAARWATYNEIENLIDKGEFINKRWETVNKFLK